MRPRSGKSTSALTPINLREVYAQKGEYSVKMLIDTATSAKVDSVEIRLVNADGSPKPVEFRRWGTKLTLSFEIDDDFPDGVSYIDVRLRGREFELGNRYRFWVFK